MGSSPTTVILLTILKSVLFHLFWTRAYGIFYHYPCYYSHNIQAWWPSGLRHWFKAPVTLVAWVRVPLLSFCWHSYRKYCFLYFEHLHVVSSTIMYAIYHTHQGRLAEWTKALVLGTSHFGGVGSSPTPVILLTFLYKVLFSLILSTCTWYLPPSYML